MPVTDIGEGAMFKPLKQEQIQTANSLLRDIESFKATYEAQSKDPSHRHPQMILALQDLVKRARALDPQEEHTLSIVSDMARTRDSHNLLHLADREAGGHVPAAFSHDSREIELSRQLTQREVKTATTEGLRAKQNKMFRAEDETPKGSALDSFGILPDNNETRAFLTTLEKEFKDGESVFGYAQRSLTSYVATLLVASGNSGGKSVDELAKEIEPPSKEQVAHILAVQAATKKNGCLPERACDEKFAYGPLVRAIGLLPNGKRIVTNRHAETSWVDLGWLTGGGADVGLNSHGKTTAMLVGLMTHVMRFIDPASDGTLEIVGHSGGNALREAAFCSAVPGVRQMTNGAYKPDTPHVMQKEGGAWTVRELTAPLLKEKMQQQAASAAPTQKRRELFKPA